VTQPASFGTPFQLIKDGMIEAGYLGKGRDPSSEDFARYMNKLNYIFNFLQIKPGLKLWLNYDLTVSLIKGQTLYSLGPTGNVIMTRPLRITDAYYTDSNSVRRPVNLIGRTEWDTLSTTVQTGPVTSVFVDKQQMSLNVYTWLTPDTQAATGTLHVVVSQQTTQVINLYDTINLPIEWYLGIMWEFAKQICTGQPQKIIDRCTKMAEYHIGILEDWDVEDASTYFTIDQRMNTHRQRFSR
jgi:hypothetical protein